MRETVQSLGQDETRIRATWLSAKPSSLAALIAAYSTLFLLIGSLIYWRDWNGAQDWMSARHEQIFDLHQYWRLWSTLFVHFDEKHLLGNSFLFFVLGYFLNGYYRFWVFPVAAFFMGGLTNFVVLKAMAPGIELMGASGIVFWMGAVWLTLYLLIDTRKSLGQRGLRASGVALVLFFPAEAFDPSISYKSHLIGFALGAVFALGFYLAQRKKFLKAEIQEIIPSDLPLPEDLEKTENALHIG